MISLNGKKVDVTIFPDKTSQVWKLDLDLSKMNHAWIKWDFEHEGELMHVLQLNHLLKSYELEVGLEMPYLPYARQDKPVSNHTTFALRTFAQVINNANFTDVKVLDPHNGYLSGKIFKNFRLEPITHLPVDMRDVKASHICFPDKGAVARFQRYSIHGVGILYAEKVRNQETGEITGLKILPYHYGAYEQGQPMDSVVILDDICDGGMTFIKLAEQLKVEGFKEIHLYVTHGLFTKGLQVLRDAGISRIFTHRGEVK